MSPKNLENISNFEGWGLTLVAYKKISVTKFMHCSEAAAHSCSSKKVFLRISQNSQKNTCVGVFFHNKVAGIEACNFIKKTPAQVFFCEHSKILRTAVFIGLRPATLLKKRLWHRCFSVNFATYLRAPILKNICKRQLLERSTFTDP